ncbi:DUF4870 domain-containing protein [Actinacidiphila sp. bgisy167]|uniref:DUF4870 domain-containing protein n=1 Tax=Actinacidiphila sp. bgisy167 TaxID=3413797 RepID=UPI003D7538AB
MTDFSKHEDVPPQGAAPTAPPGQGQEPDGPAMSPPASPYPPPPAPVPNTVPPYGYGYAHGPVPFPPPPPRPPTTPAMWAHLGALLTLVAGSSVCCLGWALAWVAPLVIRSNQHNKHDPFVRHHTAQAINYGITTAIVGVFVLAGYGGGIAGMAMSAGEDPLWLPLTGFGVMALAGLHMLVGLIFCIVGSTKANSGQWWTYPKFFALPFLRG